MSDFYRIKPHTPATRKPSYMDGLDYIARNDESAEMDKDAVTGMASVHLLAALFGVPAAAVAFDVVRIRALIAKNELT